MMKAKFLRVRMDGAARLLVIDRAAIQHEAAAECTRLTCRVSVGNKPPLQQYGQIIVQHTYLRLGAEGSLGDSSTSVPVLMGTSQRFKPLLQPLDLLNHDCTRETEEITSCYCARFVWVQFI